jgi:hypothetical protein
MSVSQAKACSYFAPMAAAQGTDGSVRNNVIRRPVAAGNTSEALDTSLMQDGVTRVDWAGKYVDVKNEDGTNSLDFAFSAGPQTLVFGQQGTFTAGSVAAGWRLGPGETKSVVVPPTATHVNWIGTGGTIAFYVSEGVLVK